MADPTPPPGNQLDLTLTDMAYGGDAVGRADGQVVFAWGGITGEQVTVAVEQVKRDIVRGRVIEVAPPGAGARRAALPLLRPLRRLPVAAYRLPGPGGFQDAHPARAVAAHRRARAGDLDAALQPALGMADPGTIAIVPPSRWTPPRASLGYYRRESHTVVPVAACPISDPGINDMLTALQALIDEHATPSASLAERVDLHRAGAGGDARAHIAGHACVSGR